MKMMMINQTKTKIQVKDQKMMTMTLMAKRKRRESKNHYLFLTILGELIRRRSKRRRKLIKSRVRKRAVKVMTALRKLKMILMKI
jgi:hypothetical protein